MIPRLLERSLAAAWAQFPIVVLTGARQVGKTTLARHFLPKAGYVTLDVPAEAELARLNPADLFAAQPSPLILDEVQYAVMRASKPESLQFVIGVADEITIGEEQ